MLKIFLSSFLFLILAGSASAQILFPESFALILDPDKRVKGSVTPSVKFLTQRRNLISIDNTADFTIRLKKNALTIANQIEFQKFGNEAIQSGGFIYTEYRNLSNKWLVPEIYAQVHWAEARGLDRRFAGGVNARFVIQKAASLGLFAGIGTFYEFERWTYAAVDEDLVPKGLPDVVRSHLKNNTYISYKHKLGERYTLDFSVYHQARYDELFSFPRLASSSSAKYALTENMNIIILYQNIYDYAPVVPINEWFHRFVTTLQVAF